MNQPLPIIFEKNETPADHTAATVVLNDAAKNLHTGAEAAQEVRKVRLPRLNKSQLEAAQKAAATLVLGKIPADLSLIKFNAAVYDEVSLNVAEAARKALTDISRELLNGVTLKDLQDANMITVEIEDVMGSLDVGDLSPEAKKKWLGLKESVKDIINRVAAFFNRYQQVNNKIDGVIQRADKLRAKHTVLHQQLLQMGFSTWDLFMDLRISFAAVKIFLDSEYGYKLRDALNDLASKEIDLAKAEERDADQLIVRNAADYQAYIERTEMYGTTLSGAIVDTYQKGVAIAMLRDNELIIKQGLKDLADSVIPGWRDMIALGWAAYQAHGALKFIEKIKAMDISIRDRKAAMIGMAATEIAKLKKSTTYDPASMQRLNDALASALTVIKQASAEGVKIRATAEEINQTLVDQLSEVVAKNNLAYGS